MLIKVEDLSVESKEKKILEKVDFEMKPGEVQALLGPNASGKSTFAQVILGNPNFKITKGKIVFKEKDITEMKPEERVDLGISLSWQHPPTIKGVKFSNLLDRISKKNVSRKEININSDLLNREVNLNFSGGEKRMAELLQILSLDPKLVIFDEIDSGLDMKMIERVAEIIKREFIDKKVGVILITHSGDILNFLKPGVTNVMVKGKIICKSNDYKKVLKAIKKYGYEKCKKCKLLSS